MFKKKSISRFFILLSVSFIVLIAVFSISAVQQSFTSMFCVVEKPIFNMFNPHIYVDFLDEAPPNEMNWDIAFKVWDEDKHDTRLYNPAYRASNTPNALLAQNSRELIIVPFLFLIALLIATPMAFRRSIIRSALSILFFLIFIVLYLSYRFEFTLQGEKLPFDSIWHGLIWFFGLGGNIDTIFIIVFLIWLVVVGPGYLFRLYSPSFTAPKV